jgi:L-asparagine oxygenase
LELRSKKNRINRCTPVRQYSTDTNNIQEIALSKQISENLQRSLISAPSPYTEREAHLLYAFSHVVSALPMDILGQLHNFRNHLHAPSMLHIRNLPIDPILPETPIDGGRTKNKTTFVSEACLSGLAQLVGVPFGFTGEKQGELIHTISPVKGKEKAISNEGSLTTFSFHTENAYFNFRPTFIGLYCLRSDHEQRAATTVVDVRSVLPYLSSENIHWLQLPEYSVRAPLSFERAHGDVLWSAWRPILSGPIHCPELLIRLPDMKVRSPKANKAFAHFVEALDSHKVISNIFLEPGDLLFINNRMAVHGRSFFVPRWDGQDRWLQRMYVRADLWEARGANQQDFRILE